MFNTNATVATQAPSRDVSGDDFVIEHLETGGYKVKGRFFARLSDVIDMYGWGDEPDHGNHDDHRERDHRGIRVGGAFVNVGRC